MTQILGIGIAVTLFVTVLFTAAGAVWRRHRQIAGLKRVHAELQDPSSPERSREGLREQSEDPLSVSAAGRGRKMDASEGRLHHRTSEEIPGLSSPGSGDHRHRPASQVPLLSADEITNILGLRLVAHIGESSLAKMAGMTSAAAQIAEEDLEPSRMLADGVQSLGQGRFLRTIAVTSALPQEGRTTIASSIAVASVASGRRTLLVECDRCRPTFSTRFRLPAVPGLTDFLNGQAEPQHVLRTFDISARRRNVSSTARLDDLMQAPPMLVPPTSPEVLGALACITSGSSESALPQAAARLEEFLAEVAQVYEIVCLDWNPLVRGAKTLEPLPGVDAVIVCVRQSLSSPDDLRGLKAKLDRLAPRPMGVVVVGPGS